MTPEEARAKEADEASSAFQLALSLAGAATVAQALSLWTDVPVDAKPVTVGRWLEQGIKLISLRRSKTRALALSYFRLVRALRTGKTIADPYHPGPTTERLADLRQEFFDQLGPKATYSPSTYAGDDADVKVDEIPGLRADLDAIDQASEKEARIDLQALGPNNLNRKTKQINTDEKAKVVDLARKKAHKEAGNRQAASAARIAMNGARSAVWHIGNQDTEVIGYARLSRTGTPCGWCAMLISKGFIPKSGALNKSDQGSSAEVTFGDLDLYHDNCHCYAEPVYGLADMNSPRFELNRRYAKLWPLVTKGLKGKAALSAWRNFIRREQQGAQVAAA